MYYFLLYYLLGWPVILVAKICTKNRAISRTEFIHCPREERGQTQREM